MTNVNKYVEKSYLKYNVAGIDISLLHGIIPKIKPHILYKSLPLVTQYIDLSFFWYNSMKPQCNF